MFALLMVVRLNPKGTLAQGRRVCEPGLEAERGEVSSPLPAMSGAREGSDSLP